jgi:predicted metal-dependent phosphoesterase TrpH
MKLGSKQMFKVDLHTHSIASPDGGITKHQYQQILDAGTLDAVAVTDHNSAEFALELWKELGNRVIVGEEIMSSHGEIIGLYLTETIPGGLSPLDTIRSIKDQGGLVYIPHPFETIRKGMSPQALEEIAEYIDIMEVCNGRAFMQNRSSQAVVWTRLNHKVGAASSDAHGIKGIGKTFSSLAELPVKENLVTLLEHGVLRTGTPSPFALLYPKYHRLRKRLRKSS